MNSQGPLFSFQIEGRRLHMQSLHSNQNLPQSQSDTLQQNIKHKWKTMQINEYNLCHKKKDFGYQNYRFQNYNGPQGLLILHPLPKHNLLFYPLYTYLCVHTSRVQCIHLFALLPPPKKLLVPPMYQAFTKTQ